MSKKDITDFDREMLKKAYSEAVKCSTDRSTQNGAAIALPSKYFISAAANTFPMRVLDKPERHVRPVKYAFVEHAERNAIYKAARDGVALDGATMYACWFACADCARAIIQVGITRIVGHDCAIHKTRPDWKASIADAMTMFKEAKIKIDWIDEVMGFEILFNGQKVKV